MPYIIDAVSSSVGVAGIEDGLGQSAATSRTGTSRGDDAGTKIN